MGTLLKKLWTDEDAFLAAFRSSWAWLVGVLYVIAEMISQGIINLGEVGWYGGRVAQAVVVMLAFQRMRAGTTSRSGINPEEADAIKRAVGLKSQAPPVGNVTTAENAPGGKE